MNVQIAFRVDASLQIGTGHVMRCLALADALCAKGAQCHFLSRAHPGHLMEIIRQRGYEVNSFVAPVEPVHVPITYGSTTVQGWRSSQPHKQVHGNWLGSTWEIDAQESAAVLAKIQPDWLVVDHYAIDQRWEEALAAHYRQLLVIDDLAERPHRCNLLLDQNLGRRPQDYSDLVPAHCQVLTGPIYSLLRPEFAALRPYSLKRRRTQPAFRRLLVTMGGVDQPNATKLVLQALKTCTLPQSCRISVVMGLTAPWLQDVRELADHMPWSTEVVVNVSDMAQRMADSDLVIGAAGSTSWERCCLGAPTLMVVLAENQRGIAKALVHVGAAMALELTNSEDFAKQLQRNISYLVGNPTLLRNIGMAASCVTDGCGINLVVAKILGGLAL
jgi:UDP-2,4-diacetamido-2,4,6-trideoxy-beta-L-altropyranose hydrolase